MSDYEKPKLITEKQFLRKVYAAIQAFKPVEKRYQERITALAEQYVRFQCPYKVGQVLIIKDRPDGYTQFTIELIAPEINWEKGGSTRFKASGTFLHETEGPKKGFLFLDELKKKKPNVSIEND